MIIALLALLLLGLALIAIGLAAEPADAPPGEIVFDNSGPDIELVGWDVWMSRTGIDYIPATVSMSEYLDTVGEKNK
jgi:hypothetical protein